MPNLLASRMAGFLLSFGSLSSEKPDLTRISALHIEGEAAPGWIVCDYITDMPIPEVDILPGDPPFHHGLLLRWGRNSLLALGHKYRVIQHLVRHQLKPILKGTIRGNEIRVHDLVLHMVGLESRGEEKLNADSYSRQTDKMQSSESDIFRTYYTLSFVAGRTDAFGEDLRKIQFYGDRVSSAALFRYGVPLMRFYSCQLRQSGIDIVRLGSDGYVDFKLPTDSDGTRERLKQINRILRSLIDRGYII